MKKQIKSDFEIVKEQFKVLNNSYYNSLEIKRVVNRSWDSNTFGMYAKRHIKSSNYKELFEEIFKDESIIIFMDDSFIRMKYVFDDDGRITFSCLDYMPNLYDLSEEGDFTDYFTEQIERYIRVDLTEEGRTEVTHTLSHLHIGLYNNLRIPIKSLVYPFDFIYIVLKYIYLKEDPFITSLIDYSLYRRDLLTDGERDKLRLTFGK